MLRALNALLYAAAAVAGATALAPPLLEATRAVVRPFAYAPDLNGPWVWFVLAGALLAALTVVARRIAAGERVGLLRYGILLGVAGACIAARRGVPIPLRATVADGLGQLIARVEHNANAAFERDRVYPLSTEVLEAEVPEYVRDLGYRSRGARALLSTVHVVQGASGPVLRAPEGIRPGDAVFAVDDARQRCWITAFRLDRTGRISPILDNGGRAVVATGVQGRPSSRLDPLFPDYPHQSAPALPGASGAPRR